LFREDGTLVIGDLGLSRIKQSNSNLTNQVGTRWYKAPELLYGSVKYDEKIDIWSVGCIFAQLMNSNQPPFVGDSDIALLSTVVKFLGTPNEGNWKVTITPT
jgi:serine/threonine protein kinase